MSIDWKKLMAVRLIIGLLSPKTFDSYILDMMYVDFMTHVLLADSRELLAVIPIWTSSPQKRSIPSYLDMMYVGFMKNFLLADSFELLAVRLSLSSWGQKRLIPTF